MYIISISGNLTVITLVKVGTSLHCPMYFFISVFAALEIIFVSVTIPKLLANLISGDKRISFMNCIAQLFVYNSLGVTECYMLTVMAFDRDLAINNPLRYSAITSNIVCIGLVIFPFTISFTIALVPTVFTADLIYCGPNEINHFFCDLAPVQNLACSDPLISNLVTSIAAVFASLIPFVFILGFYTHIIITIANIKSVEGKYKAFSTCSSHLTVACLFYISAMVVYIKPKGNQYNKFLALMHTVVIPFLNPFIYTLRNKDVKDTFQKFSILKLKRIWKFE
ncbi:olfactory receptor 5P68-like [Mantella aurantiaca]